MKPLAWPRGLTRTMASFLSTQGEDNWKKEIASSVEEAIRAPLDGIRDTIEQMKKALCILIVPATHNIVQGFRL